MSIFLALRTLEEENKAAALCTVIESQGSTPRHTGSKMLVYPDGRLVGTVGGGELENRVIAEALQSIKDGQARRLSYQMADPERGDPGVCGGQVEVYVEPILPKPTLVLIGAGHVGKAVAHLASWVGFRVVVNDDRPGFCTPEVVPGADEYYPIPMAQLPEKIEINPWTYVVLTTRGMNVDVEGLPELLKFQPAYIGLIGSKRRWQSTRKKLLELGMDAETLDRIRSPIGLELKAETPEEIAVSILAEIIMVHNGGDGRSMSSQPSS